MSDVDNFNTNYNDIMMGALAELRPRMDRNELSLLQVIEILSSYVPEDESLSTEYKRKAREYIAKRLEEGASKAELKTMITSCGGNGINKLSSRGLYMLCLKLKLCHRKGGGNGNG